MSKTRYRAVIFSPHLDDAVFSCGGEIVRLVKEGPVLVLNLFTRYLENVKNHGVVLGAERYVEEETAARLLGFKSHNFGELDVVFRRKEYRSLGNIFRPPVPADLDYLNELRKRVFDWLAGIDYQTLYIPLAIGWHVDHMLTFLMFAPWFGKHEILCYEDAPYCLIPNATRLRLVELGQFERDPSDQSLAPKGLFASWRETSRAYANTAMMKNLKPAPLRWLARPVVSTYFYRLMKAHQGQTKIRQYQLTRRIANTDQVFERKLAAAMAYRSQFREFFIDADDCRRLYANYGERIQGLNRSIESYWQVCATD